MAGAGQRQAGEIFHQPDIVSHFCGLVNFFHADEFTPFFIVSAGVRFFASAKKDGGDGGKAESQNFIGLHIFSDAF